MSKSLFIVQDDSNSIAVSAYSVDDPLWESNHIILTDARTCRNDQKHRLTYEGLRNIFTNILRDAEIPFCEE